MQRLCHAASPFQTDPIACRTTSEQAKRMRAEAKLLPPGPARDEMIRKAREAEIAAHLNEWLGGHLIS
jgi:hypothetical protein